MHFFNINLSRKETRILQAIIFTFAVFLNNTAQGKQISFTHDKYLESDAGYLLLDWKNTLRISVELQQASQPDFVHTTTLYQGKNSSFMLSGLSDGTYYYRIRAQGGEWSDTVALHVSHHSLIKAWLLFILGACVFFSTVWVIAKGTADES